MIVYHRSHRLVRLLTAGLAAAALAAPPALARPIDDPQVPVRLDPGPVVTVDPEPAPADAPIVVRHIDAGFDWGSAAIGAGGAGALIVLVSFGGYAYTTRHRIGVAR